MDIETFTAREQAERAAAEAAADPAVRAEHLAMAERYRAVAEALARVQGAAGIPAPAPPPRPQL